VTVLAGATLIFLMVHLIPGDPVAALLQDQFTAETYAATRARLGLDRPLGAQYLLFLQNVATGRLGTSFRSQRPVTQVLAEQFPYTVELATGAIVLAVGLGVPLGMVAAVHRGHAVDYLTMGGGRFSPSASRASSSGSPSSWCSPFTWGGSPRSGRAAGACSTRCAA